ncbi:MAG: cytochrome c3 family protein, partial [Kiritimatiellota bacterium]|nr:cytochrome c3 family protein [Kiritimatiellota bacterium]
LYVAASNFEASVHGALACVRCHADLKNKELPHVTPLAKVACAECHERAQQLNAESLHGQALARGDPLAPRCQDCHGAHDIAPAHDLQSAVAPLKIPFVCGRCHHEGAPVQRLRTIHQDHILENYSESIHGEGLFKKGLVVSATCVSCHTAHHVLPHTDARSSIARNNITATCLACHAEIEAVHRKSIKGELWEKEAHVLPACVDCHQPHKVRKVYYEKSAADADCLRCHAQPGIRRTRDGLSLQVNRNELMHSRHAAIACSQCHASVNPSLERPCAAPMKGVDCAACHVAVADQFQLSRHGALVAAQNVNAPTCIECHGTHAVRGKTDPASPTFPTKVPELCARCHREGEQAAARYIGAQHQIIERYTESIHGKGLLKSGLTVTATCTGCHTAHNIRPKSDSASSVNPVNLPQTCGRCHHGIEEQFNRSIHSPLVAKTGKPLPVCNDCHTAHTIRRTDKDGFKLEIMSQCGRCHEDIAKNYFNTYHGKVSQLGYSKTAKCYDCHGAHDVLPIADPRSHLSREHVVETCRKCHPGATRRFAGYLTHATHHDPRKYPFLFWTFWGMTTLLVGTFAFFGIHTLLWLSRALQIRRERLRRQQNDQSSKGGP